MDEFNFIFLALGFLMTIWSWMSVKKKAPERRYPLWYRGLQLFCMAVILAPSAIAFGFVVRQQAAFIEREVYHFAQIQASGFLPHVFDQRGKHRHGSASAAF